ncbi:putative porin [uncultured Shewanella sp.]|uniref:putative porin n=1 Tax=uncultured Shewanella sp. TaxID=173975 RepID=UPI00262DACF3|nr:putative porin [uncultured Shewanella sp.]
MSSFGAIATQDRPYQHEASVGYVTNTEDVSDGILGIDYRYYATPISQSASPYALNGFLAQVSNVGINYSVFDAIDIDTITVDADYIFDSKFFVGMNYQRNSIGNIDLNAYGIELGYYVNSLTAISAVYDDGERSVSEGYGVKLRHYLELESTPGIDLIANWLHENSDNSYELGADWYVSNSWSVGSGYVRDVDGEDFDIRTAYSLRLLDVVTANFAISKMINSDVDGVNVGVAVTGRF